MGLTIYLDDQVYEPKEDSFLLHDTFLNDIKNQQNSILEIGAGSGYIILSIALKFPHFGHYATDINFQATQLILYNAQVNGIENLQIICGDVNTAFRKNAGPEIIIFNPPYLPKDKEIDPLIRKYEYYQLIGGEEGFEVASNILQNNEGAESTIYLIISSLSTNPEAFARNNDRWFIQVLQEKKMEFESIWVIKANGMI